MNTENTTTTNTNPYLSLKPRQQLFVRYIAEWYDSNGVIIDDPDRTYNRGVLRTIAQNHAIEWAPAWIVKDTSRNKGRGEYIVPEVYWYMSMAIEEEEAADRILSDNDVTTDEEMVATA
jgi:hypothetical protein